MFNFYALEFLCTTSLFFPVVCPEIWEMKICVFSCVLIFILFDYLFNSWYKTRLWICFFIITHQVFQGHFLTNYTFSPALCSPRRPFGVWSLVFLFLFYSTVFCVTVSSLSFFFSKKKKKKLQSQFICLLLERHFPVTWVPWVRDSHVPRDRLVRRCLHLDEA